LTEQRFGYILGDFFVQRIWSKYWFGLILGDFSSNASGHPGGGDNRITSTEDGKRGPML
jgi:hypothetical protein